MTGRMPGLTSMSSASLTLEVMRQQLFRHTEERLWARPQYHLHTGVCRP